MKKVLLFFLSLLCFSTAFSQIESESIVERKNVVKWNATPMLLLGGNNFVFGYERVLKNHQSFSLNVGYLELPDFEDSTGESIEFFNETEKSGYVIAADYRFYLKNRNRFAAPDGLYWGPFASVVNLGYAGESSYYENGTVQDFGFDINSNVYSIGVQIGYQLLLKNGFGVDMFIVAPSFSHITIDVDIDSTSDFDEEDVFFDSIENSLSDLVPGMNTILNEDSFELSDDNRLTFNGILVRYGVQLSYAF